jgi:hypothetical protein
MTELQAILAPGKASKREVRRLWEERGEIGPCKAPYHTKNGMGVSVLVPCRDCMPCRRRQTRNIVAMAAAQAELSPLSWVDTLTYAPENMPPGPYDPDWLKQEFRRYKRRVENAFGDRVPGKKPGRTKIIPAKFKYLGVAQLGTHTNRLHFHIINFPLDPAKGRFVKEQHMAEPDRVWPHGHIMRDAFSPQAAAYVVGYLTQKDKGTIARYKSQLLGWEYFQQWLDDPIARSNPVLRGNTGCFNIGSKVCPIPRAWRDRAESLGYTFPDIQPPSFVEWIRDSGPLISSLRSDEDRALKRQKERERLAPREPSKNTFQLHLLKKRKRSLQSPQELVNA